VVNKAYQRPAFTRVQLPTLAMFFVTSDLELRPIERKINGFPGIIKEPFLVKFGHPRYIVFEISCRKTDAQTNGG